MASPSPCFCCGSLSPDIETLQVEVDVIDQYGAEKEVCELRRFMCCGKMIGPENSSALGENPSGESVLGENAETRLWCRSMGQPAYFPGAAGRLYRRRYVELLFRRYMRQGTSFGGEAEILTDISGSFPLSSKRCGIELSNVMFAYIATKWVSDVEDEDTIVDLLDPDAALELLYDRRMRQFRS